MAIPQDDRMGPLIASIWLSAGELECMTALSRPRMRIGWKINERHGADGVRWSAWFRLVESVKRRRRANPKAEAEPPG